MPDPWYGLVAEADINNLERITPKKIDTVLKLRAKLDEIRSQYGAQKR